MGGGGGGGFATREMNTNTMNTPESANVRRA